MRKVGIKLKVPSKMKPEGYIDVATVVKTSNNDGVDCDCGFAVLNKDVMEHEVQKYETVCGIAESKECDTVYFHGGISQIVNCSILSTHFCCWVEHSDKRRKYKCQKYLSKKSERGDSGALLIKKADDKAVGLVFACAEIDCDGIEGGIASPISKVQEYLEVTLITKIQ